MNQITFIITDEIPSLRHKGGKKQSLILPRDVTQKELKFIREALNSLKLK